MAFLLALLSLGGQIYTAKTWMFNKDQAQQTQYERMLYVWHALPKCFGMWVIGYTLLFLSGSLLDGAFNQKQYEEEFNKGRKKGSMLTHTISEMIRNGPMELTMTRLNIFYFTMHFYTIWNSLSFQFRNISLIVCNKVLRVRVALQKCKTKIMKWMGRR